MIEFAVAIFWIGLTVIAVTLVLHVLEQRARKRIEEADKEGHP